MLSTAVPRGRRFVVALVCLAASVVLLDARPRHGRDLITDASIRGHMQFLASDALRGRASGSTDEWLAATYIASQLARWQLEPLGDAGGFVRQVETPARAGATPSAADRPVGHTWNVVGQLTGRDPKRRSEVVLLSAHLDHLGVRGTAIDNIFNGADDDASGSTAVLELAEALASGKRPKRTVMFAWFGSEESGGFGARDFLDHPPVPLDRIMANLEFEMIGRPDEAVPHGTLWLTGYERTTLGGMLAAHGARLVADPHPRENFFSRSDNIQLAYRGVVAQTISSFGLHPEYHTPADDLAHIDFAHLTRAVRSMFEPVRWLLDTQERPSWRPDMQPVPRRAPPR